MKIDAHQHFWLFRPEEFLWMGEDLAALKRDFLPEHRRDDLRALGFDGSLAVQARQNLEETRWLLDLARRDPSISGVVGWIDLCSLDVEEQIQEFLSDAHFVGVRHMVQNEPDGFLGRPDFLRGMSILSGYGLTFDLLVYPRQLPEAVNLVRRFPHQTFILNHMGKPYRSDSLAQWEEGIRELAACPRVCCKLSGMLSEQELPHWLATNYTVQMDVVLDAFGPDRILVGSDWPVCLTAGSYTRVMGLALDYLSKLSEPEQLGILGENATRVYGLAPANGN